MATLTMPQLGESVTEGTILQWLKELTKNPELCGVKQRRIV